ncbi:hypothetical protein FDO65_17520 [Nakamurella flava]|uniref:LTD domain-containing protein n=1 Tax=Nakamurella flava TaxID=2576308 RepID=A0A4U6QBR4_9ACTN|nr:IPT/TIG domain-containing protein [Nakamurella flava]TKV57326.1 hypothetical protein FDO65_17520 [Nakamurella flava]
MKRPPWLRRLMAGTVTLTLVAGATVALPAMAAAATTVLFQQSFHNNTPDGVGAVVRPAGSGVANTACLTATGGNSPSLPSCPSGQGFVNNTNGAGALSLTPALNEKTGGLFAATSVPTSQGLDVSFDLHQYSNSNDPADGLTFALSAVDPANPTAPPNIGPAGGSLGYAAAPNVAGLSNAYLGLGFDVYGYYSSTTFFGTRGCGSTPFARPNRTPYQVVVRGPGNGLDGYCALDSTATSYNDPRVNLHGTSRAGSTIPVRVLINSSKSAVVAAGGITVPAESYYFAFTPIGQPQRVLTKALPVMSSAYVGAPSWLDSDGLPKQLAFGWAAATGGQVMNQEVDNVTVASLTAAVPRLTVDQNSYTPATNLNPGDPVGYVVRPGVAEGTNDPGPVSVTMTTPTGVAPRGASGDGWSCAAPSGRQITCTRSGGPFPAGQDLPLIAVTAVATASVAATSIQTGTTTTVSSDTGQAAITTTAPAGANPPAPQISRLSPDLGSTAGGIPVTISGSDLAGATSIAVGTAQEIAAGTAPVLLPCSVTITTNCFTLSNGQLVVPQWPAHAAGAVIVSVVALGRSGSSSFSYVAVAPGALLISEFRLSGPNGDDDEYVELTNVSGTRLPIAGLSVQTNSGAGDTSALRTTTLPMTAAPLPAGGTYLVAGPAYSLGAVATADYTSTTPLGSGGVRLVAPDAPTAVVDAVGPSGIAGFTEGTGLPAFSVSPSDQYGWVRTRQTGAFKATDDNAADFALVSTTGGAVGGVQSMLGSPSPSGLTTPADRSAQLPSTLLDPTKPASAAPNRVVTKGAGSTRIETRRVVTNNTGQTITALQLRLIDITEANGLTPLPSVIPSGASLAQLKAVTPPLPTVQIDGRTVSNLAPASPSVPGVGGGLNSTLLVPLEGTLAPGQSVTVAVTMDATGSGKFFYRYSTEALLGS